LTCGAISEKIGSENDNYQILFLPGKRQKISFCGVDMSAARSICVPERCPQKMEKAMKVVKHGDVLVVIIEHSWEKSYLKAHQGKGEWLPVFLPGSTTPFAEIDPVSRRARLCPEQELLDQKEVVLYGD
jgi:hypothetical protein